jgi:hypothetical protein
MSSASAFAAFAAGDFEHGLARLERDPRWHDSTSLLDGPFHLGLPGKQGWSEGLLIASLLKRHAACVGSTVEVTGAPPVLSILQHDPAFVPRDAGGARSPIAVLRQALAGRLLANPFVPIEWSGERERPRTLRWRIGVAWESVGTSAWKRVPREAFLRVVEGFDAEIVSFQRGLRLPDRKALLNRAERFSFVYDHALYDEDQSDVVDEIRALDCMVTISTTTAHIAACFGIPVVLLAAKRGDPQWYWRAQGERGKQFYPSVRPILSASEDEERWWEACILPARNSVLGILVG